jgi:hypothetical protein
VGNHIHMTFGLFYLTVIAVAAITAVSTGLVVHLRNRDVRAQYAYIRTWVERPEAERLTSWANTATSAWRRLYIPPARRGTEYVSAADYAGEVVDYVWPTPEPWPVEGGRPVEGVGSVESGRPVEADAAVQPAVITKSTVDERYRTLAPALIEASAQKLLDTVAWPDLSDEIAGMDRVRTGRHRADRR